MGNQSTNMSNLELETVLNYQFLPAPCDDTDNGLYFNNIYIPEEVLILILSYVKTKHLLKVSLVCKKWCRIIRSYTLWSTIYKRKYSDKPKMLPWYIFYSLFTTKFYNRNLLKNGNGENKFKYWQINKNYGDEFKIEDPPQGADALPANIEDFNGKTSCFATSFYECDKEQIIYFNNNLLLYIINKYKPTIYLSEWVAGRFDCGCVYTLTGRLCFDNDLKEFNKSISYRVEQWQGREWSKKELLLKDYPEGVIGVVFQHVGNDSQFWKGHYGSKMAGGVVKILFESIQPLKEDNYNV